MVGTSSSLSASPAGAGGPSALTTEVCTQTQPGSELLDSKEKLALLLESKGLETLSLQTEGFSL